MARVRRSRVGRGWEDIGEGTHDVQAGKEEEGGAASPDHTFELVDPARPRSYLHLNFVLRNSLHACDFIPRDRAAFIPELTPLGPRSSPLIDRSKIGEGK